MNNIFVLKSGAISESGSYEELMNRKGAFAEFLIAHIQEIDPEEEDLAELKNQLENTNPELVNKLEEALLRRRESVEDSDSANNSSTLSLSRQTSVDSAGAELRQRRSLSKQSSVVEQKQKTPEPAEKNKLIEQEKSEVGSVKWDVYKHYLKSIGVFLSVATIILNVIFQGFAIGSNIWLSYWSVDTTAGTDTSVRNMYLGVYGAFGLCQGMLFSVPLTIYMYFVYCLLRMFSQTFPLEPPNIGHLTLIVMHVAFYLTVIVQLICIVV